MKQMDHIKNLDRKKQGTNVYVCCEFNYILGNVN